VLSLRPAPSPVKAMAALCQAASRYDNLVIDHYLYENPRSLVWRHTQW
jgi:hypothetical protein